MRPAVDLLACLTLAACAEVYGGPARARVTGELRGQQIDARFSRVDGCEIKRWNDNAVLLAAEP
jgi:hypothetical protein